MGTVLAGRRARLTIDADVTPGVTACYLRITGGECAFIETHTAHALPRLLAALVAQGRRPEDVRFVVVTHAHLDHAAGASALLAVCPRATLLAHPRAARNLIDPGKLIAGAKSVYGEVRFAELYGRIDPIPASRVRALEDGEGFELGGDRLTVAHTAGHAFHHFAVDDPALDTVYTGDTFGLVYPALQTQGRFAFPSTSPTGFHAAEALRSLDRVLALGRRWICPTHFDAWDDAPVIAAQLRRFIERAGAWVEEASRGSETGAPLQERFEAAWRDAILAEAPTFGAEALRLLALDLELNAKGLVSAVDALRTERASSTPALDVTGSPRPHGR